jgi:hypothetical protein
MTGIAGQRGRSQSTPAQAAAARRAARKRPASAEPLGEIGEDPEVQRRMDDIGLGQPTTWAEAKIREQTRAEIYRTLAAAAQLAEARRTLVPASDVPTAVQAALDQINQEAERLPRQLAEAMTGLVSPTVSAQLVTECSNLLRLAFARAIDTARQRT